MTKSYRLLTVLAFWVWATAAAAQTLSLTFDDGLNPTTQQRARLWNDQIIAGLKGEGVTAMVFPSLSRIGGEAGIELIRAWAQAGHNVGNHTSKHRSLSSPKVTLDDFISDVVEGDAALSGIPGFVPMIRFPFLKEGDSIEKRDGFRRWMTTNGYKPAAVSIDASDWYYDQLFVAFTNSGSLAKVYQVQKAYIEHLIDRATYYDGLAKQLLGRSPKHVMLLHTNAINAASVGAIITAFRARGWQFVSPASAFGDPMYALQPSSVPAGESIVWALAKERGISGLRYPGEDSVYEEPKLRALGLLP
jgi:peptidoglycan-N-acetylglucosamine deacetylase